MIRILILTLFLLSAFAVASGQTPAQDRADNLKFKLEEVKSKQSELQDRLNSLEEQLTPETLDNSLAGVGSTHPEDLREAKRRQLENEKSSVQKQLNLLTETQTRLESSVAQADADAYHESARVKPADDSSTTNIAVRKTEKAPSSNDSVSPAPQVRPRRSKRSRARHSQDEN